jgi:hypothetical protein
MQFHCEVDAPKVRDWLVSGADEMAASKSPGVQCASAIKATLDADLQVSQHIASHIYQRWAKGLQA